MIGRNSASDWQICLHNRQRETSTILMHIFQFESPHVVSLKNMNSSVKPKDVLKKRDQISRKFYLFSMPKMGQLSEKVSCYHIKHGQTSWKPTTCRDQIIDFETHFGKKNTNQKEEAKCNFHFNLETCRLENAT